MKILWVNSVFLHPTTRGGQIRTLAMLKQLSRRHEIHYAALADPDQPEGPARSSEYCARAYPVPYRMAAKASPAFLWQLAWGLVSPVPVVTFRKRSARMRALLARLLGEQRFDSVVCDFLTPSINLPRLEQSLLFQHNVETMIWRRYAENAAGALRRAYFRIQAERMFRYERRVCRAVRHVVAVSEADAELMRTLFGLREVSAVPTGVEVEWFSPLEAAPPPAAPLTAAPPPAADLVFVGSMDYLPNIDGVQYFAREILPRIRRQRPQCTLTVAGREPDNAILALAQADPGIRVTGTVADVRPYLWGSAVSIVPLRIGGGTRLKIYESMAACTAVVSTTIGAEGLTVHPPADIRIADTPEAFAADCLRLLENPAERQAVAQAGRRLVAERFSWEQVSRQFEQILQQHPLPVDQPVPHA
jgi:sugar transferase (PEP-CTERM/EpsH1 system associated)